MLQAVVASRVPARESANQARYPGKRTVISLEFYPSEAARSETVEWALNATAATIQNVRVNHRCPDVLVAEQFLDGPDVVDRQSISTPHRGWHSLASIAAACHRLASS